MSEAIAKINYTHDALIDAIIATPGVTQRQLAAIFGYTEGWISQVMSSDVFKERLAARRGELIDPTLVATIEEKLDALARKSLDVVTKRLMESENLDAALKALPISLTALGYGARDKGVTINQQFVALMPEKAKSAEDWSSSYAPQTIEVQPERG